MARKKKCVNHTWMPANKRTIKEACAECNEPFPCQEPCGHLDCEEAYGKPPVCSVCNKRVGGASRFYAEAWGGKLLPVHESCGGDEIVLHLGV